MAAGRKRTSYGSGQSKAAAMDTMRALAGDISRRSFQRAYLLYGSEAYLRVQFRNRLKHAMTGGGDSMNVSVFSGKNADPREIIRTADTVPFFADRRVVIVTDSGFFKSSRKELADYIARIPETTSLIFEEEQVDTKNALFQAVREHGLAAQLSFPDDDSLKKWLLSFIKSAGKQIRPADLDYFLSIVAPDMNALHSEMEKVICYTGEAPAITRADIDAICCVNIENKVFDLIRAIAEKKQSLALSLYHDIVLLQNAQNKAQRSSGMSILAKISSHFDHLGEIKSLRDSGMPPDVIAQRAGLASYFVKKNLPLSERFPQAWLRAVLEECTALEEAVKSGQLGEDLAAELLITRLSKKSQA